MIRVINGTPDDLKQQKRVNQIIEKKEVLLNDLQKNLNEIQECFSVKNNNYSVQILKNSYFRRFLSNCQSQFSMIKRINQIQNF